MENNEVVIFWFRRDLRLHDNRGLQKALRSGYRVLPVFIFDTNILDRLEINDSRVTFLCDIIDNIQYQLHQAGRHLVIFHGTPGLFFREACSTYKIKAVYSNVDYEPYAISRDNSIKQLLEGRGIPFYLSGDQLIFEPGEVLKQDGTPYTVFTPFSKKWLSVLKREHYSQEASDEFPGNFVKGDFESGVITPEFLGFQRSVIKVKPPILSSEIISDYAAMRDYPAIEGTTGLGPHLRFGTVSIREVIRQTEGMSQVFTSELIWREFFMHILSFFPHVTNRSFRPVYDNIEWLNNEEDFGRWRNGMTGFPIVDAGMRELSATGYMHNRVRMITAGFLVKQLLCDWRWGEAWFAIKLLDFELSSNNGNWQWAAGTGCDAAPWFRVFNPETQQKKFDPQFEYIKKWVPESGTPEYPSPITDNREARERAISVYKKARGLTQG